MKKILLFLFILSFLFLFLSIKSIFGYDISCGGTVQDMIGSPIQGVAVYIYTPGITEYKAWATTNTQGRWSYTDPNWPNQWDIDRIEFRKDGHLPITWRPSRGVPYDCQTGVVQMGGPGGTWACVNPRAALPEEKCIEDPSGQYSNLTTCAQNCRLFKCYVGDCVPCGISEDPANCPYSEPTCNNGCSIGPTPADTGIQPTLCNVGEPKEGIQTALGCIPTKDPTQFVAWLLKFAIGIGGGIAFLMMVFGATKVLTSSGNPEAVKAGQELITSALMGLLFIIFSLFLLQLIGVKILQIPGFQ